MVRTCDEVMEVAKKMCGQHLKTYDTPEIGLLVRGVIVMEEIFINNKFFVCFRYDRSTGNPVLIYSRHGGKSYEPLHVADPNPNKI